MTDLPITALYYPHSVIRSESLLKSALLLWDSIECIVPYPGYERPERNDFAEATELIVRPVRPPQEAKKKLHLRLQQLLKDGPPAWLRAEFGPRGDTARHLIYPDKVDNETWNMLERNDLVVFGTHPMVPPALGLLMLAILADECAGTTKIKVTDREKAYSWLSGVMTTELGGEYLPELNASHLADSYDRLITTTIRVIGTDRVPLKKLIAVRKRHRDDLRPLRQKYLENISQRVATLSAAGVTAGDKAEIIRRFELEMEQDLKDLKRELGYAAKDVLLSKEVGICALLVAGAAVAPITVAAAATTLKTVGVGALMNSLVKYQKARRKAFREHAMSWLYVVSQ